MIWYGSDWLASTKGGSCIFLGIPILSSPLSCGSTSITSSETTGNIPLSGSDMVMFSPTLTGGDIGFCSKNNTEDIFGSKTGS